MGMGMWWILACRFKFPGEEKATYKKLCKYIGVFKVKNFFSFVVLKCKTFVATLQIVIRLIW